MQLGTDHGSEGFKLGSKVLFEVLYFGVDGGMDFLLMVAIFALSCLTYC
jgi:hypothetical protein